MLSNGFDISRITITDDGIRLNGSNKTKTICFAENTSYKIQVGSKVPANTSPPISIHCYILWTVAAFCPRSWSTRLQKRENRYRGAPIRTDAPSKRRNDTWNCPLSDASKNISVVLIITSHLVFFPLFSYFRKRCPLVLYSKNPCNKINILKV